MINKHTTNPLGNITSFEANTNIDDYTESGIYFFNYARRPSGLPEIVNGNGWCLVLNDGSIDSQYIKQIWISMGSNKTHDNRLPICMRGKFGNNGWSDWSMLYSKSIEDVFSGGVTDVCYSPLREVA